MKHAVLLMLCTFSLSVLGASGCKEAAFTGPPPSAPESSMYKAKSLMAGSVHSGMTTPEGEPASAKSDLGEAGEAQQGDGKPLPIDRKIIQTGDVRVVVTDFPKAEQELLQLVQQHKGYLAKSEISGSVGSTRQGSWKVRVPAAAYNEFRDGVKKLGELERFNSDAQDVTEEYYDLKARIANKEAELAALRKIFEKSTGKIEDVLAVQRELSRAQGELERMKGRQRLLENLTALTTVTVSLVERGSFVPIESPTFGTSISRTFSGSTASLLELGKGIVLVAVAVTPWLPILAILGAMAWLIVRHQHLAPAAAQKPKV
jgi:hypothetical protein